MSDICVVCGSNEPYLEHGPEDCVYRVRTDRDAWKARAEKAEAHISSLGCDIADLRCDIVAMQLRASRAEAELANRTEERETVGWRVVGNSDWYVSRLFPERDDAVAERAKWHSDYKPRLVRITRRRGGGE